MRANGVRAGCVVGGGVRGERSGVAVFVRRPSSAVSRRVCWSVLVCCVHHVMRG